MNSRVLWACKHWLHFYSWSQNFCWRDDHQITGVSSCCYLRLAFQLKTGGMKSVLWAPIHKQAKNKNLVIFHLSKFGDLYYGASKQIVRSTSLNSLQMCDGNLCWRKPIPSLKHHLVANPEISHASECGWDEIWSFLMRWKAVHCSLQGALKDRLKWCTFIECSDSDEKLGIYTGVQYVAHKSLDSIPVYISNGPLWSVTYVKRSEHVLIICCNEIWCIYWRCMALCLCDDVVVAGVWIFKMTYFSFLDRSCQNLERLKVCSLGHSLHILEVSCSDLMLVITAVVDS